MPVPCNRVRLLATRIQVDVVTDSSIIVPLHEAFVVAARLAAPPLLASLVVGLIISLLQAVTQINEPSLVFLPKIATVFGVLVFMGGAMLATLSQFAHQIFTAMVHVG